jgi:hypothetical protein
MHLLAIRRRDLHNQLQGLCRLLVLPQIEESHSEVELHIEGGVVLRL